MFWLIEKDSVIEKRAMLVEIKLDNNPNISSETNKLKLLGEKTEKINFS